MDPKQLRERRAKQIADARALVEKATAESRDMTSDEDAQFDEMLSDTEALRATIDGKRRIDNHYLQLYAGGDVVKWTVNVSDLLSPVYRTMIPSWCPCSSPLLVDNAHHPSPSSALHSGEASGV